MKFKGNIEQLQADFVFAGIDGEWTTDGAGKHIFRSEDGGVMNWWASSGTVQFQGPKEPKDLLEQAVVKVLTDTSAPKPVKAPVPTETRKQIFIVHGHDGTARDQLELVLHRLGLEPFILMNTSGDGKTIIEALEGQIGKDHTADFGIVLITPDDMGYAKADGESKVEPRARQNVILETGMLISSLTRERMALVVKGHVELPSDLQGVIQLRYNDHIREIVPKLIERLRNSGFDIDSGRIASATS